MANKGKNRDSLLGRVDEKGRVVVPASVRKHVGAISLANGALDTGVVVLTRGLEPFIMALPHSEWERLMALLRQQPITGKAAQSASRWLVGSSEETRLDSYGRMVIPGGLLAYAGIEGPCRFVKMPRGFELWEPGRHDRDYGAPPDGLEGLGF